MFAMDTSQDPQTQADGLRERRTVNSSIGSSQPIAQTKALSNSDEHDEKKKKPFGRTPDGTSKYTQLPIVVSIAANDKPQVQLLMVP